jgi:hypothetical protein
MYFYTKGKLETSAAVLDGTVQMLESATRTLIETGEAYSDSRKAFEKALGESVAETLAATGDAFDKTAKALENTILEIALALGEIKKSFEKTPLDIERIFGTDKDPENNS